MSNEDVVFDAALLVGEACTLAADVDALWVLGSLADGSFSALACLAFAASVASFLAGRAASPVAALGCCASVFGGLFRFCGAWGLVPDPLDEASVEDPTVQCAPADADSACEDPATAVEAFFGF